MKKLVFGITSLSIGGAEKTLIDLCNALCDDYEITIFTIYGNNELKKYLNNKINIINLYEFDYNNKNFIAKKLISFKLLFFGKYIYSKYIKNKFDEEIAFLEGPITNLFQYKNTSVDKIAWIHTDISLIFGRGIKSYIKRIINQKVYSKYNKIIFVSEYALESFNKKYSINTIKKVVPNYINIDQVIEKSAEDISPKDEFFEDSDELKFLVVARLVEAKALDRLIAIQYKLLR